MVLERQAQLARQIDFFSAGAIPHRSWRPATEPFSSHPPHVTFAEFHPLISYITTPEIGGGQLGCAEIAKIQNIETPQLAQYTEKLRNSRRRLKRLDMLVSQTKERVANIARMHQQLLDSERKFAEAESRKTGGASEASESTLQ